MDAPLPRLAGVQAEIQVRFDRNRAFVGPEGALVGGKTRPDLRVSQDGMIDGEAQILSCWYSEQHKLTVVRADEAPFEPVSGSSRTMSHCILCLGVVRSWHIAHSTL